VRENSEVVMKFTQISWFNNNGLTTINGDLMVMNGAKWVNNGE
jgi:hypothetical protein